MQSIVYEGLKQGERFHKVVVLWVKYAYDKRKRTIREKYAKRYF